MQKDSDKNDVAFNDNALFLKEMQQTEAMNLHEAQSKTAYALGIYHDKTAADLLKSDHQMKETAEEARRHAAVTLSSVQTKSAAMLKDAQSRAAIALDHTQVRAAEALRSSYVQSNEKHNEKNEIIAWLGGSYSSGKQDE